MRWLAVTAMVALGCTAMVPPAASVEPRHPPTLVVLVIAGQSNAVGYRSFVIDPRTHRNVFKGKTSTLADKRVLFTFEESGVKGGDMPPVPLDSPQKLMSAPGTPIFGPEIGLARYLYGAGDKSLLVVKVAIDGSSLAVDWAPGSKDVSLLLTRVQSAMTWATNSGWSPKIGAFYWVQGERDAVVAAYAARYRANLARFIDNVRRELPLAPASPFVIGQIDLADYIHFELTHHRCKSKNCTAERQWNAEVMNAQSSVTTKNVLLAKTTGLPRYKDHLHLTDAAELALGKEFGVLSRSQI